MRERPQGGEGLDEPFEASFRAGHLRLPKAVDGFSFTNLSVHAAQTFGERGRMGHVTIWFDYVVPNG